MFRLLDGRLIAAAVAFLDELYRNIQRLQTETLPLDALETLAHQMRGAAGLFGARDTEAAATALERQLRGGPEATERTPLIAAVVTAMRDDAGRLRQALKGLDTLRPQICDLTSATTAVVAPKVRMHRGR
jgi:HPt (histidine-containing phosphotransfer) domain-containing protein